MAVKKGYYRFQDWSGLYSYQDWCRRFEKRNIEYADPADICISIIIKVTASDLLLLKDTCRALIEQSYPNWQAHLIVDVDDTKIDLPVDFNEDSRINWIKEPSTLSWKTGINAVKGDWVMFLNSGDTLSIDALAIAAHTIMENPSAKLIYSDYDQLSDNKLSRHNPRFWPDWSPDLLLSVNYLTAALIHKSGLVESTQKTDHLEVALLLCVEMAGKLIHIPQVLYHKRDGQASPWLETTFQEANLVAHLVRAGLKNVSAHTSSQRPAQFTWEFGKPLISIIILTRDKVELLKHCLDSIHNNTSYQNFEIILVENNSRQAETFAYYESLNSNPRVKVLDHNLPFNYSAFNNWGAQQSTGEVLLFMNNDIQCFEPGWLEELARWATRPEIGVVGGKLLYPDGTIQHAGLVIGLAGHGNHIFAKQKQGDQGAFGTDEWYRDYSAVTGACLMVRREVFDQIGGFDEQYSLAFNDIELCLRAVNAGYRVVFTPFARLIHHEGATRAKHKPSSDIQLAWQHLRPLIEHGDPYYNPNLSLLLRIPSLRRPGETSAVARLEQILAYEG
jgi:GT2 family glycosyltransferase